MKAREIEKDGIILIDYFDEHWYKVSDEVILPSVTSILGKVLSKGPQFESWLKNTGNESTYIVRKAAESGTKIHNAIENLINGISINAICGAFEKDEWRKLVNFVRWYKELDIKVEKSESTIADVDYGYAGTIDFIGYINGEKWLLDWKSGNSIHKEAHLQVAAYVNAYNKNNPDSPIQKAGIVHLGALNRTKKDLNNIGISVTPVDFEEKFKTFINVLEIYKSEFPNDKPPVSEFPMELKI
jgi:hypothetical protein